MNTPPDLDAEQEVDLRSIWERIAARWWLPVFGLLLGLVIGFSLALGGGKVYEAETLVAMGQPFSPNGGAPVQSFLTNARAVSEIVRSESALQKAARASGLRVRALRGNVTSAIVGASGPGARPTGAPLVTITVIAAQPAKAVKAADTLAKEVIARTSAQYVDTKIRAFNEQLISIQDQLDTLVPRIAQLERGRKRRRPERARQARSRKFARQLASAAGPATRPPLRRPAEPGARGERREGAGGRARGGREDDRPQRQERCARRWVDRPAARLRGGAPRRPVPRAARTADRLDAMTFLMVDGKRVAVVVPAHDEERLIAATLTGIPEFVDRILVVDDASTDGTVSAVRALTDPRVELVARDRNGGVGAAIVTGYERALEEGLDVVCVMAADNQMDPADLLMLVEPVARGEVDYAKANRLVSGEAWKLIPRTRYLGNAVLSLLTKIASGYWHVADSQTGYAAISRPMLAQLDLDRIYPGYGFPNDMLVHLNVWNARVRDFPSRPVYGVGEQSGIKLRRVVPRISWLLLKGFFWRLREKYVIRDFHPLVFFYALGILMTLVGLLLGVVEVILRLKGNAITTPTIVLVALLLISGSQFTLFAMWFDMESNKDLR